MDGSFESTVGRTSSPPFPSPFHPSSFPHALISLSFTTSSVRFLMTHHSDMLLACASRQRLPHPRPFSVCIRLDLCAAHLWYFFGGVPFLARSPLTLRASRLATHRSIPSCSGAEVYKVELFGLKAASCLWKSTPASPAPDNPASDCTG